MSIPYLTDSRLQPIRRLSAAECELLEFEGPLQLARREHRFLIGPWRPTKHVLVITEPSAHRPAEVLMVCTTDQLRSRGVEPDQA